MKFCFFAAHLCMQTAPEKVFWGLLRVNAKRFALNSISRRKGLWNNWGLENQTMTSDTEQYWDATFSQHILSFNWAGMSEQELSFQPHMWNRIHLSRLTDCSVVRDVRARDSECSRNSPLQRKKQWGHHSALQKSKRGMYTWGVCGENSSVLLPNVWHCKRCTDSTHLPPQTYLCNSFLPQNNGAQCIQALLPPQSLGLLRQLLSLSSWGSTKTKRSQMSLLVSSRKVLPKMKRPGAAAPTALQGADRWTLGCPCTCNQSWAATAGECFCSSERALQLKECSSDRLKQYQLTCSTWGLLQVSFSLRIYAEVPLNRIKPNLFSFLWTALLLDGQECRTVANCRVVLTWKVLISVAVFSTLKIFLKKNQASTAHPP